LFLLQFLAAAGPQTMYAGPLSEGSVDPNEDTVWRWEMHEFELHGPSHVENPFRDAALVGEFTSPSGKKVTAEGFYDGGDTWRLRFTPDEEGEWRYLLRGEGVELHRAARPRFRPDSPGQPIRLCIRGRHAVFSHGRYLLRPA
jgi:hypothetical protein